MKKQSVLALALLLLIPLVSALGGWLSSLINPEIAAGHPNYERNYHLLSLLKNLCFLGSGAIAAALWPLVCLLVIRSKKRSYLWLFLAALGPFGFAVLVMLNERVPAETGSYAQFVHGMKGLARAGYELCCFVIVWVLAYQTMVFSRELLIRVQAITTGVSTKQIIDIQNASSGMWAFAEGNEVMFIVVLLYLLRPVAFSIVRNVAAGRFRQDRRLNRLPP